MIIYEDNHIIVAVKPQNMPVQKDSSKDADFLSSIKEYVRVKYNKKGEAYIGMVHRLDRTTGGVMVFARTSKSAKRLSEQIKNKEFYKTYIAVTDKPINNEGSIVSYLIKNTATNTSKAVTKETQGSKEAILNYKVIKQNKPYSMVKIELITGRHHQIRVQLSSIGCAILGDKRYGGTKGEQLHLWAHKLSFLHPITKERLYFEAPLQEYMEKLFNS